MVNSLSSPRAEGAGEQGAAENCKGPPEHPMYKQLREEKMALDAAFAEEMEATAQKEKILDGLPKIADEARCV